MTGKKESLDNLKTAYNKDAAFSLDNRLILSWYPTRILKLAKGNSLLELGIGHGYASNILAGHFSRHVILEGSQQLIENFKEQNRCNGLTVKNVLFEDYETDEKFDVIVLGFILEHVDNPLEILKKYKNFLSDNGTLFVAVPNGASLPRRIGHAAGLLDSLTQLNDADLALGHKRIYTIDTLRQLVNAADLKEISTEGLFLKTMTGEQLNKLNLPENVLQGMMKVGIAFPELCVGMLMTLQAYKNLEGVDEKMLGVNS